MRRQTPDLAEPCRTAVRLWQNHLRPALVGISAAWIFSAPVYANPQGGVVVGGEAAISAPDARTVLVEQSSQRAIINWQSFDIAADELTRFEQPSAGAIALNRVQGGDLTTIYGRLEANGRLVLINPNGVVFGGTAEISTGGLVATTHDIDNARFMAGQYVFDRPGDAAGTIVNEGAITAVDAGLVAFVAPSVKNSGTIVARLGTIEMAGANGFTLDFHGDRLISFPVDAELFAAPGGSALVDNHGALLAEGGTIILSARAARGIVENVINTDGIVRAASATQQGGRIVLDGGAAGTVLAAGVLDASGISGGGIEIKGESVYADGALTARGTAATGGRIAVEAGHIISVAGLLDAQGAEQGGSVAIDAPAVILTGAIDVRGADGGNVAIGSIDTLNSGLIDASGTANKGGSVVMQASNRQVATANSAIKADGELEGGRIALRGGADTGGVFTSGGLSAASSAGQGGEIGVTGGTVSLVAARLDASGATKGGRVEIGHVSGNEGPVDLSASVVISPDTLIAADALHDGNGGDIRIWSSDATNFLGMVTARGGMNGGDGGFIEVSSEGVIGFAGVADAGAPHGTSGILLLDPKNLVIDATGEYFPSYQLVDPFNSGQITSVTNLTDGRIAIGASNTQIGAATNAGALHIFDPISGALLASIIGSNANDFVGNGGLTSLGNGFWAVRSLNWNGDRGAVTWVDAAAPLTGEVSAANSLIGSNVNDRVGNVGLALLGSGLWAVRSPFWNANRGAVTWIDAAAPLTGEVSTANSLIGSNPGDVVGSNFGNSGFASLGSGFWALKTPLWNANRGAVTWIDAAAPVTGEVSAANSLIGSNTNDYLGSGVVISLGSGFWAVTSPNWNGNRGAVTWIDAAAPLTGEVSAASSLIGSNVGDVVGGHFLFSLGGGLWAVRSPSWNGGRGAVTWIDATAPLTGEVSAANSLIGSNPGDFVGNIGLTSLGSGLWAMPSPNWNGVRGAVTWIDAAAPLTGASISAANSLIGSNPGDYVGGMGLASLGSGFWAVKSANWNGNRGAVTWIDAAAPLTGEVSAANSLIGSNTGDRIGEQSPTSLGSGFWALPSSNWNGNRGAVTWIDAAAPLTGASISAANSLIGSNAGDRIGNGGLTSLGGGLWALRSFALAGDRGAVTWIDASAPLTGASISSANSLFGTNANDQVGIRAPVSLGDGIWAIPSPYWDSWRGAVTWIDAAAPLTGAVSAANSLIGSNTGDRIGEQGLTSLGSGFWALRSSNWNGNRGAVTWIDAAAPVTGASISAANSLIGSQPGSQVGASFINQGQGSVVRDNALGAHVVLTQANQLSFTRATGSSLTVEPGFITRVLNTGTSVILQASNDLTVNAAILVDNLLGNGGALTLQAGRSILVNADIATDNGNLTLIGNEQLAAGVVDGDRDAGAAAIVMANGTSIDAGTGAVAIWLRDGEGKTHKGSGDIVLGAITAGTILVVNEGPDGGDIVLNDVLTASATGNSLVLAAPSGGNFVNNHGAGALDPGAGRFLVYAADPSLNTNGGIAASPVYNRNWADDAPESIAQTGNRFLYSIAPVLTVTADDKTREYGLANPMLTASITGFINGDDEVDAVSGSAGLTTTALIGSNVWDYDIDGTIGTLVSDFGYGFDFVSGTLSVTPASLTVTADDQSREYGLANPVLTGVITGFRNGDDESVVSGLGYQTAAVIGSNVGDYAITSMGGSATNYVITTRNDGTLSVTPASLTVTADGQSREYGLANPALTGLITGFRNGDDESVVSGLGYQTAAVIGSNVGDYAITSTGGTATNYIITTRNDGTLSVTPASLTVTAGDQTREYGLANPLLTGVITGFRNGDDEIVVSGLGYQTVAGLTSNVGDYAITSTGGTATNYIIATRNDGTLSVTPASLTVTADNQTREYGLANPALTGVITGFRNGDDESVVSGLGYQTVAGLTSNVGDYAITSTGGTATNYVITTRNDGTLSVTPASLTVTADNQTREYGLANPALTGVITGFRNGDDESVVSGLGYQTAAVIGSNVGDYAITSTGGTATNYIIATRNDGTLSVTPASLTVTADNQTREYGLANPALTGVITGFRNGDDESVVSGLGYQAAAVIGSNVGDYAITSTGGTATNYVITTRNDGTLSVTPAAMTVHANDASRRYGEANPVFTAEILGLRNGDDPSVVTGLVLSSLAGTNSPVGTYVITSAGGTALNYVITQRIDGTLTVEPVPSNSVLQQFVNFVPGEQFAGANDNQAVDIPKGSSGSFSNLDITGSIGDGSAGEGAQDWLCTLGITEVTACN